jgi:hypothetical protein
LIQTNKAAFERLCCICEMAKRGSSDTLHPKTACPEEGIILPLINASLSLWLGRTFF